MINQYDRRSVGSIQWPEDPKANIIKNFFLPIVEKGTPEFIRNVKTEFKLVQINEKILPITINEGNYDNCFVCSPYGQYVNYAKETVEHLENASLRTFASFFIPFMGGGWKLLKMNRVVIVNNWCLPTNLYPELDEQEVQDLLDGLTKKYPRHIIAFRSLYPDQKIFKALKNRCFDMIPSRLCYFIRPDDDEPLKSRMMKSDLKLLKKTDYEIVRKKDVSKKEIPRILELYRHLYIEKYSKLNLQFTENFIAHILQHDAFELILLKKNEQIDGVVAFYQFDNVITSPLFGYDTAVPQKIGLYRMLNALLILEARKIGALLNQSAGASSFKKLRRATPQFEYLAVYTKHLPIHRRLPWKILKGIMTRIGIPLLNKFDI